MPVLVAGLKSCRFSTRISHSVGECAFGAQPDHYKQAVYMATSQSGTAHKIAEEADTIAGLSERYRSALQGYFAKRVSERSEIDDLVQEVFVRLVRRARGGDLEMAGGYVFVTASSVLNDWLRRRKVRKVSDHVEFREEYHGDVDFSAERVHIGIARLEFATELILELPERTRSVFVMRRLAGLKYKEIAKKLGISVSAVEKHMRKSMVQLLARSRQR